MSTIANFIGLYTILAFVFANGTAEQRSSKKTLFIFLQAILVANVMKRYQMTRVNLKTYAEALNICQSVTDRVFGRSSIEYSLQLFVIH